MLNTITTSLLSLPLASAGLCEAGEPLKAHEALWQLGFRSSPCPSTSLGPRFTLAAPAGLLGGSRPTQPARQEQGFILHSTVARALLPWTEAEPGECRRALAARLVPAGCPPAGPSKLTDSRPQTACGRAKTHLRPPPPRSGGSGPVRFPQGTGALTPPARLQNMGKIRVRPSHGVPGPDPGSAGMDTGCGRLVQPLPALQL